MSGGKERVNSSDKLSRNSSIKQSNDTGRRQTDYAAGGNNKRQEHDKLVRSGSDSRGGRQNRNEESNNKRSGHSKDRHAGSTSKSGTNHSQDSKTHYKSSKTNSDSKTSDKRSSDAAKKKQPVNVSANRNTKRPETTNSKKSERDNVPASSKIARRSSSTRRGSEKSSMPDIQRRRTTSSGDKRSKTDPVRESVSKTSVSRSNIDIEHIPNRHRNSGGQIELKDDSHHHDDDVLSILADDDRFARETRGLLGDELNRNERRDSRRSQSSCQRFSDKMSASHKVQSRTSKTTNDRYHFQQGGQVKRYNVFNNQQNMNRTGFYKRKPMMTIRKKPMMFKGRTSRFSDSNNRFNQGENNQGMVYNQTDSKFSREHGNFLNEEINDARQWSGNTSGKKSEYTGRGGKRRGTYGKIYEKYRGGWYRNNKYGKLKGFSKKPSFSNKYTGRMKNSNRDRNCKKFSNDQRDNNDYYNENNDRQNYNDNQYDENENLDYDREQEGGGTDNFDRGVGRENIRDVNIGETGQQQIIFIPNADFQGNVDAYGNIINPDLVDNQGNLSQVPIQLLPSNMSAENAQRSDQLIFIPFVNNQLQPDEAVPVQLNNDGQVQTQVVEQNVSQTGTAAPKVKKALKKGLNAVQRSQIRKKLMAKRRQKLEKEIERKVLQKLLENAGASKSGISASMKKTKSAIKRISPPAKKSTTKTAAKNQEDLEDVSDEDKDKYDDVSDLESVSDDEYSYNRKKGMQGTPRRAFRKPGEPRINKNPIAQSKSDVRRVVDTSTEKKKTEARSGSSERHSKGRKRTVYEVHDDEDLSKMKNSSSKKWERDQSVRQGKRGHRSMSPLQITVDNDQFSSPAEGNKRKHDERMDKRSPDRKYGDRGHIKSSNRGYRKGSEDQYDGDDTDSDSGRGRSERYSGKYSSKVVQSGERQGKSKYRDDYDDDRRRRKQDSRDYHRNSRDSSEERRPDRRRSRHNRWSDDQDQRYMPQLQQTHQQQQQQPVQQGHLVQNQGLIQQQQNQAVLSMGDQQPLQQTVLTSQSQQLSNQIQPNLSLVNTGHSFDPSLPPVPQLSQSNLLLRPDMSLPPPQVSVMGNQTSLSQLTYQPALQSQPVLSLQNNTLQSNQQQQLQQATLQQQQQQLLQLQQQSLLNNNRNQLSNTTGVNQTIFQSPQQTSSTPVFQSPAVVQQNTNTVQGYSMPGQQNSQQTGRQLQQIQTNLGSQVNLGQIQTQQEAPKPLLSITTYKQQQSSNNTNQGSSITSAASQISNRNQNQSVRGVIGTLSNNQQPKPLLGSIQIQGNQTGAGSTPQFKGHVYSYQGSSSSYRSSRSNNDSTSANRSPVSNSHSKYDSRYGSGRTPNQNSSRIASHSSESTSRTGNHGSGSTSRTGNHGSGSNRNTNQTSGRSSTSGWKHGVSSKKEVESDGESDEDDDVGQLMCTKCDKVFLSKKVMRRHVRWHDKSTSGHYDVRCDRCELAFVAPSRLDDHTEEKHNLDAWNCLLCDLTFPHSQALARHFQKENHQYMTNKYVCPTCGAVLGNLKMLAHHKQGHQSALRQHGSSRRVIAKFV